MIYGTHDKYRDDSGDNNAQSTLRDLDLCVTQSIRDLKARWIADEFTSIVAMGNSGVVVAAPVALKLKCPLVLVRKISPQNIGTASTVIGAGDLGGLPLFLDDFVSSGKTCSRASKAIGSPFYGGKYLYNRGGEFWKYDAEMDSMNGKLSDTA